MAQPHEQLVMLSMPDSPIAESFRSLRSNLIRNVGPTSNRLLFVSPWPSEGKSMVCANMGVAFAQIGKKVLVADLDLRRPTLGTLFGLESKTGMAEILADGASLASQVQVTDIPNLSFLPGGRMIASPADLVSSERMRPIFDEMGRSADVVLLDSPPLSLFAEGMILSTLADGVVLVLNPKRWKGEQEVEVKKGIEEAGARILGIVLNGVGADNQTGGGYGYNYGYGSYGRSGAYAGNGKKI